LNAARVETRVREGGHAVPIDKIHSRYGGSIRTAVKAMGLVDKLWLYDNSLLNRNPRAIATCVSGKLVYAGSHRPRWAEPFFEILKP
jgi:predicted ABC-type ATPase